MQAFASSVAWMVAGIAWLLAAPATSVADVAIDWVAIGNPKNGADDASNCWASSCGTVAYGYLISRHEVTNAQYAEFLNAKAVVEDPLGLYHEQMQMDAINGGIERRKESWGFRYVVRDGFANKPVTHVTFFAAIRFSNWLTNGQGDGDTESGAYHLEGGKETPTNTVQPHGDYGVFLPTENEWYKAAYFSPAGVYFDFPAGIDLATVCSLPSSVRNRANCLVGTATEVGAYSGSPSPWGTFDQGGNVAEWTDQIDKKTSVNRIVRGGDMGSDSDDLSASSRGAPGFPASQASNRGFRVATMSQIVSMIIEPGDFPGEWDILPEIPFGRLRSIRLAPGLKRLRPGAYGLILFNLDASGRVAVDSRFDGVSASGGKKKLTLLPRSLSIDTGEFKGRAGIYRVTELSTGANTVPLVPGRSTVKDPQGKPGANYRFWAGTESSAFSVHWIADPVEGSDPKLDVVVDGRYATYSNGVLRFNTTTILVDDPDDEAGRSWSIRGVTTGNGDTAVPHVPGLQYRFEANGDGEFYQVDEICESGDRELLLGNQKFTLRCPRG